MGEGAVDTRLRVGTPPWGPAVAVTAAPPPATTVADETSLLQSLAQYPRQHVASFLDVPALNALGLTSRSMRSLVSAPMREGQELADRLAFWVAATDPEAFFAEWNAASYPLRTSMLLPLPDLEQEDYARFRMRAGNRPSDIVVLELLAFRAKGIFGFRRCIDLLPNMPEDHRWPILKSALESDFVRTHWVSQANSISPADLIAARLQLPPAHRAAYLKTLTRTVVGIRHDAAPAGRVLDFLRRIGKECGLPILTTYSGAPRTAPPKSSMPLEADRQALTRLLASRLATLDPRPPLTFNQRSNHTELFQHTSEALAAQGKEGLPALAELWAALRPDFHCAPLPALLDIAADIPDPIDRLCLYLALSHSVSRDRIASGTPRRTMLLGHDALMPSDAVPLARHLVTADTLVPAEIEPLVSQLPHSALCARGRMAIYEALLRRLPAAPMPCFETLLNCMLDDVRQMTAACGFDRVPLLLRLMKASAGSLEELDLFCQRIDPNSCNDAERAAMGRQSVFMVIERTAAAPGETAERLKRLKPADHGTALGILEQSVRMGWPPRGMSMWLDWANGIAPAHRTRALVLVARATRYDAERGLEARTWFLQGAPGSAAGEQLDIPVEAMQALVDGIVLNMVRRWLPHQPASAWLREVLVDLTPLGRKDLPALKARVDKRRIDEAVTTLRALAARMAPVAGREPVPALILRHVRSYRHAPSAALIDQLASAFAQAMSGTQAGASADARQPSEPARKRESPHALPAAWPLPKSARHE